MLIWYGWDTWLELDAFIWISLRWLYPMFGGAGVQSLLFSNALARHLDYDRQWPARPFYHLRWSYPLSVGQFGHPVKRAAPSSPLIMWWEIHLARARYSSENGAKLHHASQAGIGQRICSGVSQPELCLLTICSRYLALKWDNSKLFWFSRFVGSSRPYCWKWSPSVCASSGSAFPPSSKTPEWHRSCFFGAKSLPPC